jgi:hypothetical protein
MEGAMSDGDQYDAETRDRIRNDSDGADRRDTSA